MTPAQRNHELYMRLALEEAEEAMATGDVPVGCVIVRGDEVIGRGRNRIQDLHDPTRHAEMVAIESAVQTIGEKFLEDCTMYVTLEPCAMCAGAIVLSRIPTVVYGAGDDKTGAVRSLFEILEDKRLNHQCLVRTGVLEDESAEMLREFFVKKREDGSGGVREYGSGGVGELVLVPTPIGNRDDISKRALEVLRTADVILCEDTRRTGQLLHHYGIHGASLLSNHEHNERGRADSVVDMVESGKTVALVSDAGMPGISDPGYRAVRACREAGLSVMALPGPTAAITAAAASGLPTDALYFAGFPPKKKGRASFLDRVLASTSTIVLYESPHRIERLLVEIADRSTADRPVVVAREISKKFEEYLGVTVEDILFVLRSRGGLKGELVVIIGGAEE